MGMRGLVLQQAEQAYCIKDGGEGGEQLLGVVERRTQDVNQAEGEPVGDEQRGAGEELRKGMAGHAAVGQHPVQPEEVVEIDADEPGESEREPALARDDKGQRGGQQRSGDQREERDVRDADGKEGQQEGDAGDHLRAVAQRVRDHGGGDREHQDEVERLRGDDLQRGQVVEGEAEEEEQRPSAADAGAREEAVVRLALQPQAAA